MAPEVNGAALRGEGNWRLTVRREDGGVTVLRAVTCDERAALPEELFGLPVRALGDHALSPQAREVAGERVVVEGGPERGEWDNRALRQLTLPGTLDAVGDYAFLGCRELASLRLTDRPMRWGGGVFMNCRALRRFELLCPSGEQHGVLAYLVRELSGELDVTVRGPGGAETRLIFPEYREEYEENGPAHHFDYNISGAGHPYHHVFRDRKLRLYDYDALWVNYLAGEHEEETALRLAWRRLRCPAELRPSDAERYRKYLCEHADAALCLALEERDREGLCLLLDALSPERETISRALERARSAGDTAAVALLLERQRRSGGQGLEKTFEL